MALNHENFDKAHNEHGNNKHIKPQDKNADFNKEAVI